MDNLPVRVSIREFRAHLAQYAGAGSPIAVTRHGETIGYYLPARSGPDRAEIDALKAAATHLDALLAGAGIDEKEMLSEFRTLRSNRT